MPTTLTARSPDDLLAAVPVLLGFVPSQSVVMLTMTGRRSFHARIDLPPDPTRSSLRTIAETLLEPVRRHGVGRVCFVVYTDDGAAARAAWSVLASVFGRAGVDVRDALWADEHRWHPLLGDDPEAHGQPYYLATHPFTAQGVLEGRVVHASRADLAASIRASPERVAEVGRVAGRLPDTRVGAPGIEAGSTDPAWAIGRVRRAVEHGEHLDVPEWARLLVALLDPTVHDLLWASLTRSSAREHVALWSDGVRRAPPGLLAAPALLLGFSAWLTGDGALAWCAHDRWAEATSGDEQGTTAERAGLLHSVLLQGASPSIWDRVTGGHGGEKATTVDPEDP